MEFNIPEELVFQILIHLPVLSLLRFRCVSKLWYSLITSPNFIDSHHRLQCNNSSNVLFKKFVSNHTKEIYTLHSDNQHFNQIETHNFNFRLSSSSSSSGFKMVGCSNGVICFVEFKSKKLILWNPFIRKHYIVPENELPDNYPFGFGYDVLSNDLKVVSLVHSSSETTCVMVFSFATKSWKKVCDRDFSLAFFSWCNLGRFVYRVAYITRTNTPDLYKIMCFDLNAEVFTEIDLPPDIAFKSYECVLKATFTSFRDSLGLVCGWDDVRYDLWVLKEEDGVADKSWMKLFSVHLDGYVRSNLTNQGVVGFTTKGFLLVVGDTHSNFIVSPTKEGEDLDVQVVKYVPLDTDTFSQHGWRVQSFTESLVLLNEGVSLPSTVEF